MLASRWFNKRRLGLMVVVACAVLLVGCLDDSGSSSSGGGGGGGGSAPSSIIGYKLVQTVERTTVLEGDQNRFSFLQPGQTLTYQFIDQNTILGEGLNTVPTTSWSYSRVGSNQARVALNYTAGATRDQLTFNTSTSGRFESEQTLFAGARVIYTGSFRISGVDSGSGGTGSGGTGSGGTGSGGTGSACETNRTGTLTFWVSNRSAGGAVTVTVSGLGSRSSAYYFTSAPECGSTQTGVMNFTNVPAGSYQYSAQDQSGGTWGPGNVSVQTCGCSRVQLR